MKATLRAAFEDTARGFSPDRVVADPELNRAFLTRCRELGLGGTDSYLNQSLLNLRKRGGLRGLRSKRTSFIDEDDYRFAAEMAARFIERRDGLTVDQIVCDPDLALEFDAAAAKISPGYMPLQYHWAALNLRKARRLTPEIASRLLQPESVHSLQVATLDLNAIPHSPGLYIFFCRDEVLYIGEAESLHNRIRKHLDHSDSKGLARWLWDQGPQELHLEIHVLRAGTSARVRRALEIELIRSRKSLFNIRR